MLSSFSGFVGLPNSDNRCYTNSIVQSLYMTIGFRNFIPNLKIDDDMFDKSILKELQNLFIKLKVRTQQ